MTLLHQNTAAAHIRQQKAGVAAAPTTATTTAARRAAATKPPEMPLVTIDLAVLPFRLVLFLSFPPTPSPSTLAISDDGHASYLSSFSLSSSPRSSASSFLVHDSSSMPPLKRLLLPCGEYTRPAHVLALRPPLTARPTHRTLDAPSARHLPHRAPLSALPLYAPCVVQRPERSPLPGTRAALPPTTLAVSLRGQTAVRWSKRDFVTATPPSPPAQLTHPTTQQEP